MKITIVSDLIFPYLGGSEIYVERLGEQLVKRGHRVTWVGMRLPNTKEVEILPSGIRIRRIFVSFPNKYYTTRKLFCFMPQLFKAIDDADVVQWNTFIAGITGGIISKLKRKPHILLSHEFFTDLWKEFTDNKIEQTVYPLLEKIIVRNNYDFYICPCEYTRKKLIMLGASKEKIKVIPHGVDNKFFKPSYPFYREQYELWDNFVVGWVGRMGFKGVCYSKNLKGLFSSFEIIKEKIPSAVFLLGGSGWDDVKHWFDHSSLEIGKDVIPLGKIPQENLPNFYSSLDVFVSSSLSEGFGFTVVEAEACGTPIVCFDAGSLPEVVVDGKTGIVVKEKTPLGLSKGIVELYMRPFIKQKMGNYAVKWIKRFNWEKTAKEYEKVYENVLERKGEKDG